MLETFFKRRAVSARHRAAPFLDLREKFLEECEMSGYSRSMLEKIAWILSSLAHFIDINRDKVTMHDIELAVKRLRRSPKNRLKCQATRRLFIHIATEWVRSLGRLEQVPGRESPFAAETAAFSRYLRDERGLSPVTISTRCERLTWFFNSLSPDRESLRSISIVDVDAFMEVMGNKGWKRSSLAALCDSLRSFFRYAESRGWCTPGISAIIESPRLYAQEGVPEGPSWEDVQRLLASSCGDRPADVRDHAILMLLAVYGLRRGEVARLQLDDLDWAGERITITRSKRSRIQYFPLVPAVGEPVLRYLREVRTRCTHRALFLSLTAPIRPVSATSITSIVRKRLSALGVILPHRGPHCLRHSCASHLLASGFSLKEIGDQLGHRSANSTLGYTKIDIVGLREVAEFDLRGLL